LCQTKSKNQFLKLVVPTFFKEMQFVVHPF